MSPLKMSQYFAYGCAIVASDLPSHRELITNNENGLLVDADTGEVLTLAQAPAANFNQEKIASRQAFFNMAVQGAYEPGSTFKPLIAALALQEGSTEIDKVYNTEKGRFFTGTRKCYR